MRLSLFFLFDTPTPHPHPSGAQLQAAVDLEWKSNSRPLAVFPDPRALARRSWELRRLPQAEHRAGMQPQQRRWGARVQGVMDSFPKSTLKRPAKKKLCELGVYSPHSLLPVDVLTLHSAATALKCLAGMFSWEISVQESLSEGF